MLVSGLVVWAHGLAAHPDMRRLKDCKILNESWDNFPHGRFNAHCVRSDFVIEKRFIKKDLTRINTVANMGK